MLRTLYNKYQKVVNITHKLSIYAAKFDGYTHNIVQMYHKVDNGSSISFTLWFTGLLFFYIINFNKVYAHTVKQCF